MSNYSKPLNNYSKKSWEALEILNTERLPSLIFCIKYTINFVFAFKGKIVWFQGKGEGVCLIWQTHYTAVRFHGF